MAKQEIPAKLVFKAHKVLLDPGVQPAVKAILAQLVQLDNKVREAQLVILVRLATVVQLAQLEEWVREVRPEIPAVKVLLARLEMPARLEDKDSVVQQA